MPIRATAPSKASLPLSASPTHPAALTRPLVVAQAVRAVARLVGPRARAGEGTTVEEVLVAEARELLDVPVAALVAPGVTTPSGTTHLTGAAARATLAGLLPETPQGEVGAVLVLPLPAEQPEHLLVLADPRPGAFAPDAVEAAEALAAAGAAALKCRDDAERQAGNAAAHRALTRAAAVLHESLDLPTVLERICEEATRILDAEYTVVYRGSREGAVIQAAYGIAPELVGYRIGPDVGLSGKVLTSGRSMFTNDYAGIDDPIPDSPFRKVTTCLGVPMSWDGELGGVLCVSYERPFTATEGHLRLLEAFAGLAAIACANASAHAGLALAARTDGLTGCLNHAALHESLTREIERAERAGSALSLVMIDLDDFKAVNEEHGHLVGDEVLRRAGHSLRQATRPYDVAARYGGDEFALVTVEADEEEAEEIARRAVERVSAATGDLCKSGGGRATAGVAQWHPGLTATELVANADRALMFGKHETGRGGVVLFTRLPEWFRPARFTRRGGGRTGHALVAPRPAAPAWPAAAPPAEDRLRDRARQLAQASALGVRLTACADPDEVLAVLATELGRMLGAAHCTVFDAALRSVAGSPAVDPALASRALEEGRSLLQTDATGPARLAVPLTPFPPAAAPWGALEVIAGKPGGLGEDDLRLAEDVCAHAGAALGAAQRYAALARAYEAARGDAG